MRMSQLSFSVRSTPLPVLPRTAWPLASKRRSSARHTPVSSAPSRTSMKSGSAIGVRPSMSSENARPNGAGRLSLATPTRENELREALADDFVSQRTHRDADPGREPPRGADAQAGRGGTAIGYAEGDRKTEAAEPQRKAQAHLAVLHHDLDARSLDGQVGDLYRGEVQRGDVRRGHVELFYSGCLRCRHCRLDRFLGELINILIR